MKLTLSKVNKYIQTKYPEIELVKGENYFYVASDNDEIALKLARLFSTSIYVSKLNNVSLDKWLEYVEYVLEDSERSSVDREPVYPK
jgi:hypothetical protein